MSPVGLDMHLFAVERGAEPELGPYPEPPNYGLDRKGWAAQNELVYWRKANQVHRWFIENCAGGVDDQKPVRVHSEVLPELYDRCQRVLADHSLAPKLLPTQGGLFFGATEYDDFYFYDLQETVKEIKENVIDNPNLKGRDVYYVASW